ncbi:hypothetical protein VN1338_17530 [Helicobacter pylori]
MVHQVADAVLATGEVLQQRQSRGFGQGVKQCGTGAAVFHSDYLAKTTINRHIAMLAPPNDEPFSRGTRFGPRIEQVSV